MCGFEKLNYTDKKVIMLYCKNNMNVAHSAEEGMCQRSYIYYHLNRTKKKTGLNPLNFEDLVKLYTYIHDEIKQKEKEKQKKIQEKSKRISKALDMLL